MNPVPKNSTSSDAPLFTISEKPEAEVSYLWKGCQLLSFIVCIASGFCTSLAIGSLMKEFKFECILHSNLTVVMGANQTVTMPSNNGWGEISNCNFCQYGPVASVIFAGVWATLFMMCGRGGTSSSSLPQAWRIVPVAFLSTLVFVILSTVTVASIFGGFSYFCSSLVANLGPKSEISSCDELASYNWLDHHPARIFRQIMIAKVSSVFTLLGWTSALILLIVRCVTHADFHVHAVVAAATDYQDISSTDNKMSDKPRGWSPLISVEKID